MSVDCNQSRLLYESIYNYKQAWHDYFCFERVYIKLCAHAREYFFRTKCFLFDARIPITRVFSRWRSIFDHGHIISFACTACNTKFSRQDIIALTEDLMGLSSSKKSKPAREEVKDRSNKTEKVWASYFVFRIQYAKSIPRLVRTIYHDTPHNTVLQCNFKQQTHLVVIMIVLPASNHVVSISLWWRRRRCSFKRSN